MFGGGADFVLVVGDEGAVLCEVRGRDIVQRLFAASPAEADEIRRVLEARPRRPVSLLIDVLDIVIQRETLPALAPWESEAVVRRRMAKAFGGFPFTGGRPIGREGGERRERIYLLAGVAPSAGIERWHRFLGSLPNPLDNVALLPIEASTSLARLTQSLGEARSDWQVLLTRERTGGFRQVICKDGTIVFSRLTRSLEPDAQADAVAAAIEQEFAQTIDYMKRLGFSSGDGLDLVIMAAETERAALAGLPFDATNLLLLTPYEAAGLLGLGRCVTPDDAYSDLVHALAYAQRARPRLRLMSEAMAIAARNERMRRRGYMLAAGLALAGAIMLIVRAADYYAVRTNMAETERQRRASKSQLMSIESALAEMPGPRDERLAELRSWEALTDQRIDPAAIMTQVGAVLGDDAQLLSFDWQLQFPDRPRQRARRGVQPVQDQPRRLALQMSFALQGVDHDRAAAVALAERLGGRLAESFTDYVVVVTRLPVPVRPGETLRLESGDEVASSAGPAMTMEVSISSGTEEGAQ
jgi:hypothetical protein